MVQPSHGVHHFHKRKRVYKKGEPYPHPDKWKRLMDRLIYIVAILGPLMTIPQVIKIWVHKIASGVSLLSWGSYLVLNLFWLTYGIMHKEKPIIIASCFWLVLELFVVVGVIVYG